MIKRLKFVYRNYKNEIEERIITPDGMVEWYSPHKNPEYHPDGGWLLSGIDQARNARRSFELKRIIGPITEVD